MYLTNFVTIRCIEINIGQFSTYFFLVAKQLQKLPMSDVGGYVSASQQNSTKEEEQGTQDTATDFKIWKYGNMKLWKYGNMEIWKNGNMVIWKYGNMEIWK